MSLIRRALFVRRIVRSCIRSLSTDNRTGSNILTADINDVVIPRKTIPEFIYPAIEQFHKYEATECPETGRKYTYGDIRIKSRNLSKALRKKLKLEKGDVVAVLLPNVPEYPIAALGAAEARLIITTLNPIYTSEELSKQLLDSSTKAIITLGNLHHVAQTACNAIKKHIPIITIKEQKDESLPRGAINFDELINSTIDIPDFEPGDPNDVVFLPYSSGTTGLPKGVKLTHNNLVANICQLSHTDLTFYSTPSENFQEILPSVLPMYHIYAFTSNFHSFLSGAKLVTIKKFIPDLYISVMKHFKPTVLYTAPPLVLFLTAHPNVKTEYFKSVRMLFSGAAPLGPLDEQKFLKKAGSHISILQGYGLTETSPVVLATTLEMKERFNTQGSIGKPIPNTSVKVIAVDDPTGKPLGPNQTGELLVKGPQVMSGYHNRPEETKNAFLDGWFRTGDLVHYNDDKLFFITDRLKELIKVKGFQVAPAELEEIIRDFPSVEEAGVIGIPHPLHGEVPRAYVVLKKSANVRIEELQEFVAQKVAKHKKLEGGVEIVDTIPKNASGKILRRQLKLQYLQSNA